MEEVKITKESLEKIKMLLTDLTSITDYDRIQLVKLMGYKEVCFGWGLFEVGEAQFVKLDPHNEKQLRESRRILEAAFDKTLGRARGCPFVR